MLVREKLLYNMYNTMLDSLGPSHWWPGESRFEKAVGAILTQSTNWRNVEKAIWNLKDNGCLSAPHMYALPEEQLAELIRPAGYFRVKAGRLKHFLTYLKSSCRFSLDVLAKHETGDLRRGLLAVKGIGPETADSILLYALDKPSFVVDAYTARILNRHNLVQQNIPYEDLRGFFMDVLPEDTAMYNEYHALLVRIGKVWCKKTKPLCPECPLSTYLE